MIFNRNGARDAFFVWRAVYHSSTTRLCVQAVVAMGGMKGKTMFSPSRSHCEIYCYFLCAVIFMGLIKTYFRWMPKHVEVPKRQPFRGNPGGHATAGQALHAHKEIEGKVSSPSRSIVERIIFITVAVIFIFST